MPKKQKGGVRHIKINLLPKQRESVGSIFVKWGVNAGKIIIIVTELVALSALFYRFSVDRKIIDLNDQIKTEEIFINNQKQKEQEYRSIQKRLEHIKLITDETDEKIDLMDTIINTLKNGEFSETNLNVDYNSIQITGNAFSIFAINDFIDQMKNSPKVNNIALDEVSSGDEGIQFSLNLQLNTFLPDPALEQAQQEASAAAEALTDESQL